MNKRNINIDLIKCVAVFSTISVHFFANTGFYNIIVNNNKMYIAVFFRTMFMVCVPLFLTATGYLMKNKELNKKYFFGISRVVITYLLDAIIYLLFLKLYYNDAFTIKHIIKSILNFDIGYSWYIKMYIGLFIFIPFINLIYKNLNSKKYKRILLFCLLLTTSFQGIINIKYKIIPDWWVNIYPITYYFIGCYIREYKININKFLNIILLLVSLLISTLVNIYVSYGNTFVRSVHNDWGSILILIPTVLLFALINNLELSKIGTILKKVIIKLSELSLAMYLTSAFIDIFIYDIYFKNIDMFSFVGYLKANSLVLLLSISLSIIINIIYKLIDKYVINKIKNIVL